MLFSLQRPGVLSLVLSLVVLGLAAVTQAKLKQTDLDSSQNSPAAWISEAGLHYKVAGRPLSLHDNEINLQRVSLGAAKRDKSARFFNVPEIGQYLVRVQNPVRKNLAKDLRSLAVGTVRYLPLDTFVAVLPGSALSSVMALDGVEDLYLRPADSKIARELLPEFQHLNLQRRRDDPEVVMVIAEMVEVPAHSQWHEVVATTMEDWRSSLRGLAGPKLDIALRSGRFVAVTTDKVHMEGVVGALAEHPLVAGVMGENVMVKPQNHLAGEAIQSGPGYSEHRMWDKGLLGEGEIVSVSDTGLDFDMGWFADTSGQPISFCGADVDQTNEFEGCANLNHRKIVSYRQTTGSSFGVYDSETGHGTHVAGIVGGAREDGDHTVEGTGMCPRCKLVIDDMADDTNNVLYVGSDISKMMQHSYNVGARLHSCSLGKVQGMNWYGDFSRQWDGWLHLNDDSLVLSAAGNYGFFGVEFSIVEPALAKNTLTVGATQNGRRSGQYNQSPLVQGVAGADSSGDLGGLREVLATSMTRKDFVTFKLEEWEAMRPQTSKAEQETLEAMTPPQGTHVLDPFQTDLTDASATYVGGLKSPQLEMREVSWGRTLGSNEVVAGPLVALGAGTWDLCMCGSRTDDRYPYDFPSEPWTLIVHWDFGYGEGNQAACLRAAGACKEIEDVGGSAIDTAWANIMELYTNHGMQGLLLIEPNCGPGSILSPSGDTCPDTSGTAVPWDAEQWFTLQAPAGVDAGSNKAPFPVGQVMRAGSAVHAYTSGGYYLYSYLRDYYYGLNILYEADTFDPYIAALERDGSQNLKGVESFAFAMEAVWPHDQRGRIAAASSRGPTLDLRFIPDILCPGDRLKSARSDGSAVSGTRLYDLTLKTGTSMATPACAGGAALIRQYLREGWYGDGTKNSGAGESAPSGALVKAMMVHSAQPVTLLDTGPDQDLVNYFKPAQYPNFHAGFGRLSLDHVLMFEDSGFTLKFGDRLAVDQGDLLDLCLLVTDPAQPLVVTLTWTDPPAVENTVRALVNDLDLVVVSSTGEFHYGNGVMWTDESNTAGRPVRDSRNNVEKVTVAVPTVGKYSIRVIGTDVPDGPQNFAYVVTGSFSDADGTCGAVPWCENDCSGHGSCNCVNGNSVRAGCQCNPTHSGTDCSFENVALSSSDYQIELGAASTAYYTIDASACSDVTVTYTVTQGSAYVLIAEGVLPVDYGSAATVNAGINARLHYAEYGDAIPAQNPTSATSPFLPAGPTGEQTFSVSAATMGTWVMSVTSVVDPKGSDEHPLATATLVSAKVVLTGASGCAAAAAAPLDCGAQPTQGPLETVGPGGLPTPPPGAGGGCPPQDATYAGCELAAGSWPAVTQLEAHAPQDVVTGGLGGKMVEDSCEVYVCVAPGRVTGCTPPGWLCFFYDEAALLFRPWGTKADLAIF